MTATVGLSLAIIVLTTLAIWVGSVWLEEASAKLADHYTLPQVVQGGIIAAVGSSMPELASVVFAALAGSFGLGVGAVVGSAIFNVLVIPALAVLLSPGNVGSTRTLVHKETLFYMLSIVVLLLTFALALIYNPTEASLSGELSRPLVLLPLVVYLLYLFLQWQDTTDYVGDPDRIPIDVGREWLRLVAGLLVILVAVWALVEAVLALGESANISEFLWGVTIVAAATSVPDALVSIQAASKHRDVASIANVLGSNTFDLLVVIPVGVLLTGSAVVNFGIAAPMMASLVVATVLLFVTLRTGLELTEREAQVLLVAYGLFFLWLVAEATAVIAILPR